MRTQFVRATGELESLRWGWWHVQVLSEAIATECDSPLGEVAWTGMDGYTFTREWRFLDTADGELLDIHVGDSFRCWRE